MKMGRGGERERLKDEALGEMTKSGAVERSPMLGSEPFITPLTALLEEYRGEQSIECRA